MKPKIGDRFKNEHYTWEVVSNVRKDMFECWVYSRVILQDDINVGNVYNQWYTDPEYEYLGNFSKVDKFTELYEILAKDI